MNLTPCPPLLKRREGTQFLDFPRKILIKYYILDEIFIFAFPSPFRGGDRGKVQPLIGI